MTHRASRVPTMKNPAEGLGLIICWVDDARNMLHLYFAMISPFLDSEMLKINMTRMSSCFGVIDHINGCLVIFEDHSRPLWAHSQFTKHRAKVLDSLFSINCCDELSFRGTSRHGGLQLGFVNNRGSPINNNVTSG